MLLFLFDSLDTIAALVINQSNIVQSMVKTVNNQILEILW